MQLLKSVDLTVGWNGKAVADRISFELAGGQIIAIAGPNGAGKSTILKSVARQVRSLSGQVLLEGQEIWQIEPKDFARKVAYLPQSLDPGQTLTVQELVSLGRNPHQQWWSWSATAEDRQAIRLALEKTGTWDLRNKYLTSLSGGEKQRAAIATALAQQPQFMLLDEPTAHLDFRHQLELAQLLADLRAHGLGILVVLHDLNLMAQLSDRILLLEKPAEKPSRVIAFGRPEEVLKPEILRQVYEVEVSILSDPQTGASVYTTSLP